MTKKIAAAVVFCLMVATMAVPSVVGDNGADEGSFDVERNPPGGPITNAESVEWTAWANGVLWVSVKGYGVSSVTVEIYDVTDNSMVLLLVEKLGFGPDKYATLETSQVEVGQGLTYEIVAIPGGKPGSSATVTLMFSAITENEPPVAHISAPGGADVDEMVVFDGSGSYDPDGMIIGWEWNLGDGNTASGEIVTHAYSSVGTYTVTLTVTDDVGATGVATHLIAIEEQVPPPGVRTVTWTISNFFESYLKSTDPADLGHHTDTFGLNSWWDVRGPNYGDVVIRDSYPFVMAAPPYPAQVTPDVDIGYYMYTPYRVSMKAWNIPDVGTAASKDAVFIPVLEYLGGDPDIDGGTVEFNWYGTYMTRDDLEQLASRDVDYWAQTYYGVSRASLASWDDGYVFELHGTTTFDRAAAAKYLGLTGSGPLKDQFDANQADIVYDWFAAWDDDANGRYDIYTGFEDVYYDLHGNIMAHADDNTDPDTLVLRMWHASWGDEVLMTRYLEVAGIAKYWQPWYENWYISGSIGPDMGNFSLRGDAWFHLQAWADGDSPAWMVEAVHIDYLPNDYYAASPKHVSYPSPFNPYDPTNGRSLQTDALRTSYVPGTTNFGQGVSYWVTPMEMDLAVGEKFIVKLPTATLGGFEPYVGTSDALTSAKVDELNSRWVSGEIILGNGYPDLSGYYDPATKTLTLEGPIDFPTVLNPDDTRLLLTGIPMFVFKVV